MKILLDTHLLLWWLADSLSLPAQARSWIRVHAGGRGLLDRMLVAQAQAEELVLLTADARVARYGDFVRLVS